MAAPRRKKTGRRRGASRGRNRAAPAYLWFIAGLLIGLGLSFFLFIKGYVPDRPRQQPVANTSPPAAEKALAEDATSIAGERNERRYDFFTVLPEMEVIVPEQVLRNDAQPLNAQPDNIVGGMYILQAGSFRNRTDAEQMKARLALLGAPNHMQSLELFQKRIDHSQFFAVLEVVNRIGMRGAHDYCAFNFPLLNKA